MFDSESNVALLEPPLAVPICGGGSGGSDDDDGCEHSDHSSESDADSPDTDAG